MRLPRDVRDRFIVAVAVAVAVALIAALIYLLVDATSRDEVTPEHHPAETRN